MGMGTVLRFGTVLGLCLLLAACGSRLNPLNWFGGAQSEEIAAEETQEVAPTTDPQFLVAEVVSLSVEALPSGAIVTATGLPPRQGFWEAELAEVARENGRIVFDFRIAPPPGATPTGSPSSREVIVATDLSVRDLAEITEIVVQGASNRLISRR